MTTETSDRDRIGQLDVFGRTDVGRKRDNNEDQFFIAGLKKALVLKQTSLKDTTRFDQMGDSSACLLIVADGVGGVVGGELASNLAVESVTELINQTTGCYYNFDVESENEFLQSLEDAVRKTNEKVAAEFGGGGKGPATTLTMATLVWPRAYILHIGDSRAYYLHEDRLLQLTEDQTVGAYLVDEGLMTETQAERSKLNNVLASAIGGEITPSVGLVDLDEVDTLLLCSDGLTKHVSDDSIKQILQDETTAEAACNRLIQSALDDGGTDNVTVIVARLDRT